MKNNDFVNWVKERVDWEELEENWNNVMADGSLDQPPPSGPV